MVDHNTPNGDNDSPNDTSLSTSFNDLGGSGASHYGRSIVFETDKSFEKSKKKGDDSTQISEEMDRKAFFKQHKDSLKEKLHVVNRFRLFVGKLVNNEYVQLCIIGLIIVNAIFMGASTFPFFRDNDERQKVFRDIDFGFLTIFTIELVMQFIYFGPKLLQDPWLVFDLVIIVVSWSLEGLQIIRAFRIFRAFRLVTRIKVLRDLLSAIGQVIPRMTAIGCLLILIFYIFAVLFTELFSDLDEELLGEKYFISLPYSLFTCYEMMTLEWAGIAREVMIHREWAWAPFLAFIAVTGFIVFNLIIAVICNAVSIVDKLSREREARQRGETLFTPEQEIEYCQEKFDELTQRLDEMMQVQFNIQEMLEVLATDVYKDSVEETQQKRERKKKDKKKKEKKEKREKQERHGQEGNRSPGPDAGIDSRTASLQSSSFEYR